MLTWCCPYHHRMSRLLARRTADPAPSGQADPEPDSHSEQEPA